MIFHGIEWDIIGIRSGNSLLWKMKKMSLNYNSEIIYKWAIFSIANCFSLLEGSS
jgi:hypothetical protein